MMVQSSHNWIDCETTIPSTTHPSTLTSSSSWSGRISSSFDEPFTFDMGDNIVFPHEVKVRSGTNANW